ncbi:IPT/TIG domain-containing protein [Actinoplanes sp. NEAU-A12]|uniref:IPT/TIG domain-containing protein n=1 Tax=Actinoplanes sandaracinus TaxID=3045177 RepID=A0ABT6WPI1_9ACTN|nr:IPT/TIG domain-containing protein [Actinoplanes sandaracinus]MDI6101614.1 IPT/TIG domain-containing protein [Actinoplanes sandaracinus]
MRLSRACLASAAVSALALAAFIAPASAAPVPMTLSVSAGPTGGGNTVVGTLAANPTTPSPIAAGTTPTVQFQFIGTGATTCSTRAKDVTQIAATGTTTTAGVLTVDPAHVRRISSTKITFKVPSASYPASSINATGLVLAGSQITAKWNVCVYDSDSTTTSVLLTSSPYTVVLRPTITSVVPTSSPAGGGQTITVNGTGFTVVSTPLTATIDGAALTNIKVGANGTSFTATTGPRAAGTNLALTVTAPGGTVSSLDPDNNIATSDTPIPFDYSNGIKISPNTGAVGDSVTVDVLGAGFSALQFDPAAPATNSSAHVFLVDGAYTPNLNRGVAECRDVVVVSDTELVCTLNLAADRLSPTTSLPVGGSAIVEGAYILTVVADGGTAAFGSANPTIVSSGATFTVAPY